MDRDTAIVRILEDLGSRSGAAMEALVVKRLQDAQNDLEKGKTLPRFLLEEDATFTLTAGDHTVDLPTGFLRIYDDNLPHYTTEDSDIPVFLEVKRSYQDAVRANTRTEDEARRPSVFVVRNGTLDFITTADDDYDFTWSYYKAAAALSSNVENAWLADGAGALWLMGEAGYRAALRLRDAEAVKIFEVLRKQGRAACFGDDIAFDEALGSVCLGANN